MVPHVVIKMLVRNKETKRQILIGGKKKMNKKLRKLFSLFLAILMMSTVVPTDFTRPVKAEAATTSAADYGLLDKACDGLILHCWNWSYSNIKDSMADIAAAGYTSLQTSPVQMPKDAGSGDTQSTWWKVYQPTTLSMVDHPWFGTKAEFKAMCDEAEKYGIKVIVDIVANHMANNSGSRGNCKDDICGQNDPTFRDDETCWHLNGSTYIDYNNQHRNGDASSLTHGFGGWPDLNTGNPKVQNAIISLLKECVDLGADGFRFDAAKHIELPTDPGGASDFWPNVTNAIREYDPDVYLYGEILDDSATSISNYTKYIAVTDNRSGNSTSWGINNKDIGAAANSTLTYSGQLSDNIVLWAESHDTYANDNFTGPSTRLSQDTINKSWCIQAARDFAVLYYIRPGNTGAKIGSKSTNTAWKDSQVVAVNKFHNHFSGKSEYMSSYDDSVVMVERGSKTADGGVVLVNINGGLKTVSSATTHLLADGTYKDQVSNSTFTVSGGKISGTIGSTGVAVVYNVEVKPSNTISQPGGKFTSDTLTLTLGLSDATSGTYQIGSAAAQTYTDTKTVIIGGDMAYGDSVTIKLTATDGKQTTNASYTFTKTEDQSYVAYFSKPSGWGSTVYCYAYDDSGSSVVNNGLWPGVAMTVDSASGYYKCELPDSMQSPKVIFTDGTKQYPGAQKPGLEFTALSMLYKDGSWSEYNVVAKGTVNVKYTDEAGTVLDSLTLTGNVGASYTTSAKTISGYTLKTTPSNATGTYTSSTITVTYVYSKNVSTDPVVTSSLVTGSSFKTETQTIKLTLSNAVSGTYSVDDGPVKTFTGSANVVLGQGKVADSTVTVKATATNSAGKTVTETFTYNKVFNGTINEEADDLQTETVFNSYNADQAYTESLELNFGADKSSPQAAGAALTLSGIAQGGTAPYTYKYYVNNALVATKSGSGATSTSWTPLAGSYTIKCVVTDAAGKSVTSAKKYTVEGTTVTSGWQKENGKWHYYDENGKSVTGWKKDNGKWYYMDSTGAMQTGWLKENGKWYYLSPNGDMRTGWLKINGKWYYMSPNGDMQTGWKYIDGKWYYMSPNGDMQTGWKYIDGKWYYMESSGVMQSSRWIEGMYYLKADGSMAVSEWVDDGRYYVDENGIWVPNYAK